MPTQGSLVQRAGQATVQTRKASLGRLPQQYLPALRARLRIDNRIIGRRIAMINSGTFYLLSTVSNQLVIQNQRIPMLQ
jgi:hypothetical protein